MVFIATFNNISVISWQSVLLVNETRVPGENHRPTASHSQTLSHDVVLSTPPLSGIRTQNIRGYRLRFSNGNASINCMNHHLIGILKLAQMKISGSIMGSKRLRSNILHKLQCKIKKTYL